MSYLITGGAGFIGSHLVESLQDSAAEIIVLDDLRSGHRSNLDGLNHRFVHGSITDRALVDSLMPGIDYVVNLAAMISVPESIENPHECVNVNVHGLLNVLESAARHKVKKLIHASSAAIYGDHPSVPKTEDMRPEPRSPYGITKLDGEYYLELFRREHGLATTSLRFFNVFGPRQDPHSPYAAAVPIFFQLATQNRDLTIFGDGQQTRDFIYVKDVAKAIIHAAHTPDMHGSYNVGCGQSITINQLAETIIELTGSTAAIHHDTERPGDIRHSTASIEKIYNTGWNPTTTLEQGLSQMPQKRSGDIPVPE